MWWERSYLRDIHRTHSRFMEPELYLLSGMPQNLAWHTYRLFSCRYMVWLTRSFHPSIRHQRPWRHSRHLVVFPVGRWPSWCTERTSPMSTHTQTSPVPRRFSKHECQNSPCYGGLYNMQVCFCFLDFHNRFNRHNVPSGCPLHTSPIATFITHRHTPSL